MFEHYSTLYDGWVELQALNAVCAGLVSFFHTHSLFCVVHLSREKRKIITEGED